MLEVFFWKVVTASPSTVMFMIGISFLMKYPAAPGARDVIWVIFYALQWFNSSIAAYVVELATISRVIYCESLVRPLENVDKT